MTYNALAFPVAPLIGIVNLSFSLFGDFGLICKGACSWIVQF